MLLYILVAVGVLVCVMVFAVVYLAHLSEPRVRARRALRRIPRTPIGEARDGQREKLVGDVRPSGCEPLAAPLTGRPCVYYRVKVEKRDDRGSYWEVINEERFCPEVMLEDESGRALVELASTVRVALEGEAGAALRQASGREVAETGGAELVQRLGPLAAVGRSLRHAGWLGGAYTLELGRLAARHEVKLSRPQGVRFEERFLEVGKKVAVYGLCRWEPDPDAGASYRDLPVRLHVTGPPDGPVVLSDEPDPAVRIDPYAEEGAPPRTSPLLLVLILFGAVAIITAMVLAQSC